MYTVQYTQYSTQSTQYSKQCLEYITQCTSSGSSTQCTLGIVHCKEDSGGGNLGCLPAGTDKPVSSPALQGEGGLTQHLHQEREGLVGRQAGRQAGRQGAS